jgi:hypothetical protein
VRRRDFDWLRWIANAGDLAHRYTNMWVRHNYFIMNTLLPENVFVLRYEDLVNVTTRFDTLLKVVKFLDLNVLQVAGPDTERAHCAFLLSETE